MNRLSKNAIFCIGAAVLCATAVVVLICLIKSDAASSNKVAETQGGSAADSSQPAGADQKITDEPTVIDEQKVILDDGSEMNVQLAIGWEDEEQEETSAAVQKVNEETAASFEEAANVTSGKSGGSAGGNSAGSPGNNSGNTENVVPELPESYEQYTDLTDIQKMQIMETYFDSVREFNDWLIAMTENETDTGEASGQTAVLGSEEAD